MVCDDGHYCLTKFRSRLGLTQFGLHLDKVDSKKRINNKEEYHQPGDVEVTYAKNDRKNENDSITLKKKNQIREKSE